MRVSFSHNFFVNRVEIANVAFDLLRNGLDIESTSCETEEKINKNVDEVSLLFHHCLPMIAQYRLQFLDL